MIGKGQWAAYNEAVASIASAARAAVAGGVRAWLAENPAATVAEARDAAQAIAKTCCEVYNQQASSLAAAWYDAQGKAAGASLARAVTVAAVDADSLHKTAHYQAGLLKEGAAGDFADAMGNWAENAAKRAVNDTVLANAKRDRKKGVRFARVTSARSTCAFCLMLAGRGAVYHSRKTAGELNRFHPHCSCKIVPSFSGGQYDTLVEGHSPDDARALRQKVLGLAASSVSDPALQALAAQLLSRNATLTADGALAIAGRLGGRTPPAPDEAATWASGKKFAAHAKKHASDFGLDYTLQEGRDAYDGLFSATMESYDAVAFDSSMGGQEPDECAFYFKGDAVAVVNVTAGKRVSLFKHERGVSEYIDGVWDKAHGRS